MANYTVLTENDESNWQDQTGVLYHYPPRYKNLITVGAQVVYYKGKLKDIKYQSKRLSAEPHYFGTGVIVNIIQDTNSKNLFATIADFKLLMKRLVSKIMPGI